MANCPNKELQDWKDLVSAQGEEMAYYLWDKYEGNVPKEYNTSLDQKLIDGFLKDFKIDVTEYNNLKEDLGFDSYTAADMLTKSIIYQKGEPITPEVAYFAYSMLGKQNNKIKSELRYLISKWDKYGDRFDYHYKNIFKRKGFIQDKDEWKRSIKDNIIIDFLKEKLEEQYKDPKAFEKSLDSKWTKEDFSLWNKILKAIQDFLAKFSDKFKRSKEELDNIGRSIVDEVLNRNYEYFDYKLKEGQVLKHYKETIESDKFAKELVEFTQKEGLITTGSLALRRAGEVYRPVEETVHDIDLIVPHNKVNAPENEDALRKIRRSQIDNSELTSGLSERQQERESEVVNEAISKMDWYKKVKEKYPNLKIINGFYGGEHNDFESYTLQTVINADLYKDAGTHEEQISRYIKDSETGKPIKVIETIKRNHRIGEAIKGTGYGVDFFVRLKPFQEEHENYFKLWKEIMIAKLQMGRDKDFIDWKAFVPFTKSLDSYNFNYEGFRHFNYESGNKNALEDNPITEKQNEEVIRESNAINEIEKIGEATPEQIESYKNFMNVKEEDLNNKLNNCK